MKKWILSAFLLLPSLAHARFNACTGCFDFEGNPAASSATYILNTSTLQSGATFYVSSGSVNTSFNLPYLTSNQCVQTNGAGQLVSSGGSCGGSGGSSSLQVTQSGVQITSPTASLNFTGPPFSLSATGSTSTITLSPSSVTLQGNSVSLSALNSSSTLAGYLTSTQTWTGQNTWSTPALSSYTYGLYSGSVTINNVAPAGVFQDPANVTLQRPYLLNNCQVWTDTMDYVGNQKPFASCKSGSNWNFGYQNNTGGMTSIMQIASIGAFPTGSTFTVNVPFIYGSPAISSNQFLKTNGINQMVTYDLLNSTQTWTGGNTFSSATITTLDGVTPGLVAGTNITSITGSWPNQTINAATQGGGGSSSLGVSSGSATNSVIVSSPTSNIVADSNTINIALQGTTTSFLSLRPSSVTLQGNSILLSSLLTQSSATATYIPQTSSSSFIQNTSVLQNATFYTLTGTANNFNSQSLAISSYAPVGVNGFDVVYSTKPDCSLLLNWDTETVNASWVRLPTVTTAKDTIFYECYGNPSVTTYQGYSTATWDVNFMGVMHLGNGTVLSSSNSTSGAQVMNQVNGPTPAVGEVDGGVGLVAASSQYLQAQNLTDFNLTHVGTVEAWVNPTIIGTQQVAVSNHSETTARNGYELDVRASGQVFVSISNASANVGFATTGTVNAGVWHHIVLDFDGTTIRAYIDGKVDPTTTSQTIDAVSGVFKTAIGSSGDQMASIYWGGTIDEVRISSVARSGDWIATEYNNITNPGFVYPSGDLGPVNGYAHSVRLTIPHRLVPNTDQTNFPVLVRPLNGSLTLPNIPNTYLATDANGVVISTSDPHISTVAFHNSAGTYAYLQGSDGNGGFITDRLFISTDSGNSLLDVNMPAGKAFNMNVFTDQNFFTGYYDPGGVLTNSASEGGSSISKNSGNHHGGWNIYDRRGGDWLLDVTGDVNYDGGNAGVASIRTANSVFEATPFTALQVDATQQVLVSDLSLNCDNFTGRFCTQAPSAVFQASSTSRGMLPPLLTTTQENAVVTPAGGLFLYNTTDNAMALYNNTAWGEFPTTISSPTMSGQWKWASPSPSSFTYQVNVGSITGGGLATCGSASTAESYTSSNTFACTTITAAGIGALTGNQTITLSGDSSGSGTTAISVTNAALQNNITTFGSSITVTGAGGLLVTQNGITSEFGLNADTMTLDAMNVTETSETVTGTSGLNVTYNVNAGSVTGAGLATCGDSTHALGYTSTNTFQCQSITGSGGGSGGVPTLGVSSGSAVTSVIISSPTSNVVFDSNTVTVALQGTTTSFLSLRPSSVTLQGNSFNAANLITVPGNTGALGQLLTISTGAAPLWQNPANANPGFLMVNHGGPIFGVSASSYMVVGNTFMSHLSSYTTSVQITFHTAGILKGLWANVHTNTLISPTTVYVQINGNNGTESIVITSSTIGEFQDAKDIDLIHVGDKVNYFIQSGAGTAGPTMQIIGLATVFQPNNNNMIRMVTMGDSSGTINSGVPTYYNPIAGELDISDQFESTSSYKMKTAGIFSNLAVYVTTNTRPDTTTIRFRKNGANGNGVLSIPPNTAGYFEDTTDVDYDVVGDTVDYALIMGGNGSTNGITISYIGSEFTTSGNAMEYNANSYVHSFAAGDSNYWPVQGFAGTDNAEINDMQVKSQVNMICSNLHVYLSSNSITTPVTIVFRKNHANGLQTLTIPSGSWGYFEDTYSSHTDVVSPGDEIDWQETAPAGSGTAPFSYIGMTCQLFSEGNLAGGQNNQVMYNSFGSLAGSSGLTYSPGSTILSVSSSVVAGNFIATGLGTILTNGTTANDLDTIGVLDAFKQSATAGDVIFSIGSNNQANQAVFKDQNYLSLANYGLKAGHLFVGDDQSNNPTHTINDDNSASQLINIWNGGEMDLQTTSAGSGGANIVLKPQTVSEVVVSSLGVTMSTSLVTTGFLTTTSSLSVTGVNGSSVTFGMFVGSITVTNRNYQSGGVVYSSSFSTVNASSSTGVTTYVKTNLSAQITPRTTASRIEISVSAPIAASGALGAECDVSISTTGTVITSLATNPLAVETDIVAGQTGIGNGSFHWVDSPNTTSAVTYTVIMKAAGTTPTCAFNTGSGAGTATLFVQDDGPL